MRLVIPFYAVLSVVVCDYDENSYGSPYPWSHGVANSNHDASDWWFDIGGQDSHASEYLAATSPFYQWFKNAQVQYDMYAPAKHVGKINRGKFLNPELNLPADRAFGHQSDFHIDDLVSSGAFEYRPQGQKIRARKVDVIAGIANHVGEIIKLPLPVYVKKDGTLLVNVFGGHRADPHNACTRNPDPCSDFPARPRCVPLPGDVNTVKCMGPVITKLQLRFIDPNEEPTSNVRNNINLYLLPVKHDGTECPGSDPDYTIPYEASVCGATTGEDKSASSSRYTEETVVLSTQPDGSSPQDYNYVVFAYQDTGSYNLNEGRVQLIVSDDTHGDMQAVQVITVPQGSVINTNDKRVYFFGCLRAQTNKIDLKKTGFYTTSETIGHTTYNVYDLESCNALRLS